MQQGIWNKEIGPIGEDGLQGPIGPDGPVFDGTTPLSELTVNGASLLNGLTTIEKSGGSGGTYNANASLVIDSFGNAAIQLLSSNTGINYLLLGDTDSAIDGWISYEHTAREMSIRTAGVETIRVTGSDINLLKPVTISGTVTANYIVTTGLGGINQRIQNVGTTQMFDWIMNDGSNYLGMYDRTHSAYRFTIDYTSGDIGMSPNTNIVASIGSGRLGYITGNTDQFMISHYDNHNITDYGLRLTTGNTLLNAKLVVFIQSAGVSAASFSSSNISLLKPVTMTALPASDPAVTGALWNDSGTVKISL